MATSGKNKKRKADTRSGNRGDNRGDRRAHFREQPQEDGHFSETIGADLRAARREKGLSLNDVASTLCLKSDDIRAIEESDFEALPGKTYAIGFVRAYAQLMGAAAGPEAEEFVRRFKAEMSAEENKFHSITRKDPGKRIPYGLVATAAATLMLGVGVWRMADTAVGAGDDVLEAYQPSLPQPIVREAIASQVPLLNEGKRSHGDVILVPSGPPLDKETGFQTVSVPAAPINLRSDIPDGTSWGTENHDARIRMKALADVWLRVEVEGRVMFERVLVTGDSYIPPNRGDARIVTRNAGDLEIYVDGGYIRRLGSKGDAFAGTTLDPEALLAGR